MSFVCHSDSVSYKIEACHLNDDNIIVISCALGVGVKFGLSFHKRTDADGIEEHMPI